MRHSHRTFGWALLTAIVLPLFIMMFNSVVQVTMPEIRHSTGLPPAPAPAASTIDVVAPQLPAIVEQPIPSVVEPPYRQPKPPVVERPHSTFARRWHGPGGTNYDFVENSNALTMFVLPPDGSRINVGTAHVESDTLVIEKFLSPVYATWGSLPRLHIDGDRLVGNGPDGQEATYFITGART
jgi:hypothetical protein